MNTYTLRGSKHSYWHEQWVKSSSPASLEAYIFQCKSTKTGATWGLEARAPRILKRTAKCPFSDECTLFKVMRTNDVYFRYLKLSEWVLLISINSMSLVLIFLHIVKEIGWTFVKKYHTRFVWKNAFEASCPSTKASNFDAFYSHAGAAESRARFRIWLHVIATSRVFEDLPQRTDIIVKRV